MPTYRRPGVYLEESLLTGANDIGIANAVAVFAGAAPQGSTTDPVRIDAWQDYVTLFGGFEKPLDPSTDPANQAYLSYLPYAVYSYFQNGGRTAYVMRALETGGSEAAAEIDVTEQGSSDLCFTVTAKSAGVWGNSLSVEIAPQTSSGALVYTLYVKVDDVEVERFDSLSLDGTVQGTKRVDVAVNDEIYGSRFVTISAVDDTQTPASQSFVLVNGADGNPPGAPAIATAAENAAAEIDGPVLLNAVGYKTAAGVFVAPDVPDPTLSGTRGDIFVINDSAPPRSSGQTSEEYATAITGGGKLTANTGSSYTAAYSPWIIIGDPAVNGGTIPIPPGGAVMGTYARVDATEGVFRAPAGVLATLNNVVGVDAKFSETTQGSLNSSNQINVIRPVANTGIAIMGARTRKQYGYDKYVSARRTLIYIKESLKNSTQFAVFENNDQLLWTRLRSTADRILRPVWNAGGLRGSAASEAYFITCDDTINTPAVIASGEVRMEIGVALQAPAEFIVIRISQFEGGGSEVVVS